MFQGEKGIHGRQGPPGPVVVGDPGQPVSMEIMLLYCQRWQNSVKVQFNNQYLPLVKLK